MTDYIFPPADKPLYGLTTGTVYEPVEDMAFSWRANGTYCTLITIAHREPDGVTDVRPFKAGDTISSVEELEAIPDGTILRDENGAWEKVNGCFFFVGNGDAFDGSGLVAGGNTLTILWLPETGERA